MASSGLLRRVALVRTDVSVEPGASFIRVTKIGAVGTTQAATSNRRTLRRNTKGIFIVCNSVGYHDGCPFPMAYFAPITRRHVFYFKHDILEAGFCLLPVVGPTELGPINRSILLVIVVSAI
jgi:hypothetical protein